MYIHDLSPIFIDCLTPASRLRHSASVWITITRRSYKRTYKNDGTASLPAWRYAPLQCWLWHLTGWGGWSILIGRTRGSHGHWKSQRLRTSHRPLFTIRTVPDQIEPQTVAGVGRQRPRPTRAPPGGSGWTEGRVLHRQLTDPLPAPARGQREWERIRAQCPHRRGGARCHRQRLASAGRMTTFNPHRTLQGGWFPPPLKEITHL